MKRERGRLTTRIATLKASTPVDFPLPPQKAPKARVTARNVAYKIAKLRLPGGSAYTCIVKDISKSGAKVLTEGSQTLPVRVALEIEQIGRSLSAAVVWQDGNEVGLLFE